MSWKSLVTAGLLCVLASPVFAAPTVTLVKGGTQANGNLDNNGNWVWKVQITPDVSLVPDSSGTPVAAELGFTSTNRDLLSATNLSTGANDKFDTINPGTVIFSSWQNTTNGLLDANSNNRPTGIQTNCPSGTCSTQSYTTPAGLGNDSSVVGALNQVFAALGSVNFTAAATPQGYIQIVVAGPKENNLNTTVSMTGVYGTGSSNGRLTQVTGLSGSTYTTSNFDTANGTTQRQVIMGDADMNGIAADGDLSLLLTNFGQTGKHWYQGDFSGDGLAADGDLSLLLTNFNGTGGINLGGGLSGGAIPEPASIALLGLALLGGLGIIRRKH